MKGNRAIRRALMALTLLTAYLLSTVGTAALAIGCNCPHSFYHNRTHQCIMSCCNGHCDHMHSHHGDSRSLSLRTQLGNECCHHNHSTETELYTADSDESAGFRTAAAPADAVAGNDVCASVRLRASAQSAAERRCPPAQRCRAVSGPLRAPPVCA